MTDPKDDSQADQHDATNRGVSSQEPAEGADDAPEGGEGSPTGDSKGE